jgi:hypothetical protein
MSVEHTADRVAGRSPMLGSGVHAEATARQERAVVFDENISITEYRRERDVRVVQKCGRAACPCHTFRA